MIDLRLLRAIARSVLAGGMSGERERREESDRRDVRPGARRLQISSVLAQKAREGVVAALAEKISFTDGLFGERRVKRKGRRSRDQCGSKDRGEGLEAGGHGMTSLSIRRIHPCGGFRDGAKQSASEGAGDRRGRSHVG